MTRMRRAVAKEAGRLLLLALLLGLSAPVAAREDFRVQQVETRLADGVFLMSAQIDYGFSADALEALENGVPLTILMHIQVRRRGAWVWESSLLDLQLRYAIRYKPLSERYEVFRLPAAGAAARSFVSRDAAIRALGEIRDIELVGAEGLDPDTELEIHFQTSLDIEELPLPLRPIAYLKPSWKLSSGWSKWPLTP